jgi:hypothetical protein
LYLSSGVVLNHKLNFTSDWDFGSKWTAL